MPKHILVIEDDADIRNHLIDFFQDEGFKINSAVNGSVALEFLAASKILPGLITLDLMMPVMDGWEFRKRQKEDKRFETIPVIALSAGPTFKTIDVDKVVRKPIDLDSLLEAALRLCKEPN